MAFTIVQSASASVNASGSVTKAISSTGQGNLLIVATSSTSTSAVLTPSASSGTSQTFTQIADKSDNEQFQAWYVNNCASGTTGIKVTRSAGTGQATLTIIEISGADLLTPLDKEADSTAVGTTGTTATTSQGNEFWFAILMAASLSGGAPTISGLSAGWTQDQLVSSSAGGASADITCMTAYQIKTTTGTANATATVSGNDASGCAGIVATFKATILPPGLKTYEQAVNRSGSY